jgi:hypothetical protein
MQWLTDFFDWFFSPEARSTVFTAAVLGVAVVVAGLLAAWVARSSVRHLIDQRDRESKSVAIAALIDAATEASVWNSLTPQEQVLADRAVGEADIRIRMLPIRGAAIAANWAAHQLHEMKRASATFGYELEPAVVEFRDRLVEWQRRPAKARRLFQNDLDRWKVMGTTPDTAIVAEQDAWVAQQHHDRFAENAATTPAYQAPDTSTQRLIDDVSSLDVDRQRTEVLPQP